MFYVVFKRHVIKHLFYEFLYRKRLVGTKERLLSITYPFKNDLLLNAFSVSTKNVEITW